jgi:hypothetical protein
MVQWPTSPVDSPRLLGVLMIREAEACGTRKKANKNVPNKIDLIDLIILIDLSGNMIISNF